MLAFAHVPDRIETHAEAVARTTKLGFLTAVALPTM
jgi:hypothetical protein